MAADPHLVKIFQYALNQEQTGLSFFRNSLERLGIGAAVTAFTRLIAEEEKHIAFITSVLEDLNQSRDIDLGRALSVILRPTDYFDARAKSEFLEQCIHGSMIPDVTVFNAAWLIEKDISDFYAAVAEKSEGKAHEALMMLAQWEKEHERFFRDYRDKLSEVYANMPWGG